MRRVITSIIGIEHLGVNSSILLLVLGILFGSTLGAAALAFGFGARGMVSDLLAIQQISKSYGIGDSIVVDHAEGRIVEITQTAVIVESSAGRVMIPGHRFSSVISTRIEKSP